MRISEQWLREWVDPKVDTATLAHQLTMAGLEVDAIESAAGDFSGVVVAEIVACEPHPDADKLRVCQVACGEAQPVQIVCGAPNARVGLKAPLATIGGVLPGDFKIKKAKLRGVESFGMLCSEKELGIVEEANGLMELPADAPVGQDIREYLNLNDTIIEVDLTPNRGDCLGMRGIAREVGVLNQVSVSEPKIESVRPEIDDTLAIEISAPENCSNYVGRVVRGVNTQAETPLWMQERLRRAGIRPISIVVDVTNYVLVELGQPMHAFDLSKIDTKIVVRLAQEGEKIVTLDNQTIELDAETLVIADAQKALAIAGVMGGLDSSVTDGTQDIFFEGAHFQPIKIAGKARRYGLHTDSSHRFERGVDPALQTLAIERATKLLVEVSGGQPGPVIESSTPEHNQAREAIALRAERVQRLLGFPVDAAQIQDTLTRLGMAVSEVDDGWQVVPPTFRFDVQIEADLIEEIGRVYGYDKIPVRRSSADAANTRLPEAYLPKQRFRNMLVDLGYQEVVSYSFVDPSVQKIMDANQMPVTLANPISQDMSVMRTSVMQGLVQVAAYNLKRQQSRLRLFEFGLRFEGSDQLSQTPSLAGLVCGSGSPEQWSESKQDVDFFDLKGDIETLLGLNAHAVAFAVGEHGALHPGQTASILIDGQAVGVLGAIHPQVAHALDLPKRTFLFELDYNKVNQRVLPAFSPLSKFPSVRRDISIIVEETLQAAEIIQTIHASAGELLKDVVLFDVYRGTGIKENHKSFAFGLILQEFSRTLTDHEVDQVVTTVVQALKTKFGADLRD